MQLEVVNTNGQSTGKTVDLPAEVFGVEPNEHVVYLAVKQYLAHQRQGTHKAKERAEISGSTRKIKRQKGTGTARAGSIKSPVFRGGGRIFGPRPRTYEIKLNKKVKTLARKSVLSAKAKEGKIIVVEDFSFDAPKTKDFAAILNNLDIAKRRSLIVTGAHDNNLVMSGRNIQRTSVSSASDLNVYEVLNANTIVLCLSSVEKIKETFA